MGVEVALVETTRYAGVARIPHPSRRSRGAQLSEFLRGFSAFVAADKRH
jgi:hypothetical protein